MKLRLTKFQTSIKQLLPLHASPYLTHPCYSWFEPVFCWRNTSPKEQGYFSQRLIPHIDKLVQEYLAPDYPLALHHTWHIFSSKQSFCPGDRCQLGTQMRPWKATFTWKGGLCCHTARHERHVGHHHTLKGAVVEGHGAHSAQSRWSIHEQSWFCS